MTAPVDSPPATTGTVTDATSGPAAVLDVERAGTVPWVRLVLALAGWVAACWFPLRSLAAAFTYQTPVGELVLVPPLAILLVVVAAVRHRHVWAGRLGHGDFVLAAGLLAAAASLWWTGRAVPENTFWLIRLDLAAMPLLLGAFLVLALGMRAISVCGYAVAFALLAWPYPLTLVGDRVLGPLTSATYHAGAAVSGWVGVAERVPGADNVLRVPQPGGMFEVSVGSACAGLSSLVGFLLAAASALYLVTGSVRAKACWLSAGLAAVWLAAVARIVVIAAGGALFGPRFALGVLHAGAGMVLDALLFLVLLAVLPRFGLGWKPWTPSVSPALPAGAYRLHSPRRVTVAARVIVILLVSALALWSGASASATALREDVQGNVPTRPLTRQVLAEAGVAARFEQRVPWAARYFGEASTWDRYRMLTRAASVWVDSVVVSDPQALRVHDVIACYDFHGATVLSAQRVSVAKMVTATSLAVRDTDGHVWQSMFWQWPVLVEGRIRHERVVLLAASGRPAGRSRPGARGVDPAMAETLARAADQIVRHNLTREHA